MSDIKYNRPNENWECGWKKRGFQCHVGPNPNGACSKKGECVPIKKDGGYQCTRHPQHGGKCHQGPLPNGECCKKFPPCSPQRSLRAKRGLTTISLTVLAFALLFFQLGSVDSGTKFFSPGALSFKHSSALHNCKSCHTGSHDQPLNWLITAGVGKQDSNNCLGCHRMGDHPYQAHSLSAEELAKITRGVNGKSDHSALSKKVQCNTCHKEHRGTNFDLTTMTKKQCQTCHTEKFASLEDGHPEFTSYPADQRTNILFDHGEHFNKHFPDKDAKSISCNTCHQPSEAGGKMLLNGFEKSCATCHMNQIYGDSAVEKGVVFIRIPTIDTDTFIEKGIRVGNWPEDADGELTSFMKTLLAAEDEIHESLQHLDENEITLDDLSEGEKEDLKHAEKVVWSIKRLLHELSTDGVEKIKERLEASHNLSIERRELVSLIASLPIDVVRSANKVWFKNLESEIEGHGNGRKRSTRTTSSPEDVFEDEDLTTTGGWYKDTGTFTIKYRPTGHADPFIKSWLSLAGKKKHWSKTSGIFEALSHRKDSPGACTKCHGVVKDKNEDHIVNWTGRLESVGDQGFVRFSHASHLNLLKEEGCYTCHKINPDADFSKAYKGYDKTVFESNFYSLKKDTCVRCHQEGLVKDNCLTCHNYHVGNFFSSEEQMKHIKTQLGEEKEAEKAKE